MVRIQICSTYLIKKIHCSNHEFYKISQLKSLGHRFRYVPRYMPWRMDPEHGAIVAR